MKSAVWVSWGTFCPLCCPDEGDKAAWGGGRRKLNEEVLLGRERFPPACTSASHFH